MRLKMLKRYLIAKSVKVISKYPSINVSIDELISDLVAYFLELKRIYKNDKNKKEKRRSKNEKRKNI